jgi:hypothetical protein
VSSAAKRRCRQTSIRELHLAAGALRRADNNRLRSGNP